MKKSFSVIFVLLAFILTIGCFSGFSKTKATFADNKNTEQINILSKSAYLMDAHTGTVVFKQNENKQLPIASMCKIMTLLLCFDAIENNEIAIDDVIVISKTAAGMGGSQVFLEENGEYIVGELLKSIVVASANDACVAMAERLCGNEESFVTKMNEKCTELNMNNTVFVNCTGLPAAGQHSTAKDVATMFAELIKHHEYFKFSKIWTDVVKHPNDRITEISNTNKLIRFYQGCDGGKTGYTSEAGHCLAACASRHGMRLISVIISAPDSKTRFKEVSDLFNYGFANYTNKLIIDNKKPLSLSVKVEGGKKDTLEVVAERPLFIFSKKGENRAIELDFNPTKKILAPVKRGEIIGKICVYENGIMLSSVNVLANENIAEKTYFDIIKDISKNWTLI